VSKTTKAQDDILYGFADDLCVLHKRPTKDAFDHIEDTEAAAWFKASRESLPAQLSECLDLMDDAMYARFMTGFRACLGKPTMEQMADWIDCCRAIQTHHALWQVQYFLQPWIDARLRINALPEDVEREDA
jgi:hypothetical protein